MLERLAIKYLVYLLNQKYFTESQMTIRCDGLVYYEQDIKISKRRHNMSAIFLEVNDDDKTIV